MNMSKENKQQDVPQTPEQVASSVRSYFTEDVNKQISEMTVKQMENLMKDLVTTPHWIAILKYTSMRTPLLDATLRSTDPTKEPHKISWSQGALAGLWDIETYVIELNAPKPQEEDNME